MMICFLKNKLFLYLLRINLKKKINSFCVIIYVLFSFLLQKQKVVLFFCVRLTNLLII